MIVDRSIGLTQGRVQWRLAGIREGMIHVGAFFDEELAELPMSVKSGTVEIEVLSEGVE